MRKRYQTANGIFLISFLLFAVFLVLYYFTPLGQERWVAVLYFLTQSCFIGCCADWVAVEALFRRRLSLPYRPLVPKNREQIIRSLGDVNHSLLPREKIIGAIRQFSVSGLFFKAWPEGSEKRKALEKEIAWSTAGFLLLFLKKQEKEMPLLAEKGLYSLGGKFGNFVKGKVESLAVRTLWMDKLLAALEEKLSEKETERTLSAFLRNSGEKEAEKLNFIERFTYKAMTLGGAVIDYDVMASSLIGAFRAEIHTWRDPENPFRELLADRWEDMMKAFLESSPAETGIHDFCLSLLKEIPIREKSEEALALFRKNWVEDGNLERKLVPEMEKAISRTFEKLEGEKGLRDELDESAKGLLSDIVTYEHGFLAEIICRELSGKSERDLNEFIESRVHQELEGIRINGAIVGLAAGGVLYLFISFIYVPLIKTLI
ncbi:DUF445 family protein [Dialister sp.]|uniref:DUF445 family protein n=1 Tax=Dialister sp. TaxID=1955814 RepID=UPI002E8231C6|nr:DUF445 family protein [Dialister sp.]MEE3452567.1 DUF445 family protein [Dialister sp.]